MVAAVLFLAVLNIIVWMIERSKPGAGLGQKVNRRGLLLLLYLPLWAALSNALLALVYPLFYGHSYFSPGRSLFTGLWVSLFLALFFTLLHRPMLFLLSRYLLRGRHSLWGVASAFFGAIAGALEYLLVKSHTSVGPAALIVFCVTSIVVGYWVGLVRAKQQIPIN